MAFVGYMFSWADYTGNDVIAPPFNGHSYYSDSRNYRTHYGYIGAQHTFTPSLSGEARGGFSYTDLYNDPAGSTQSTAPYADISLTYTYIPGSYAQLGFTQDINSTDVATPGADGHLTQYQQSSVVYFNINHQITPLLTASFISQYQYSKYKDGYYANNADEFVTLGVNLNYKINRHISANAGYNFDELTSDVPNRDYSRNRVYIGLAASY
jgi:hypothetical protein